ncbi:RHS repeat-associated core domain-containing protein, partial [Glaciecola sp. XM2]|uniref:RHS repeat-associated core domain-containing protein n=1 Tax=Glaciecola sp. XM2 TaxID=1914931 RepID=UPI001BDE39F8
DQTGNIVWKERYTPFGETLDNPNGNKDDQGYTGHISDSDTGLVYMQARYYDPVIGRFYSNDPVGVLG